MRKIALISICIAMLLACNKNQPFPTITVTSNTPVDTFTIIDNGVTYIDTQTSNNTNGASMKITKDSSESFYSVSVYDNIRFPIYFHFENIPGPVSGTGLFSAVLPPNVLFIEIFNGGELYIIQSVTVNITSSSSKEIKGTYQLALSNSGGSKTVSGLIKCYHPQK